MSEHKKPGDHIDYWDSDNLAQRGTVESVDGWDQYGNRDYTVWNPDKGCYEGTDDTRRRW
jgi:hypothetical protein